MLGPEATNLLWGGGGVISTIVLLLTHWRQIFHLSQTKPVQFVINKWTCYIEQLQTEVLSQHSELEGRNMKELQVLYYTYSSPLKWHFESSYYYNYSNKQVLILAHKGLTYLLVIRGGRGTHWYKPWLTLWRTNFALNCVVCCFALLRVLLSRHVIYIYTKPTGPRA